DPRFPSLALSADRRKELTLQALVEIVFRLADERATVLAIENLHWADPTTLELCSLLVQELRSARAIESEEGPRLLAVFTTRPELAPHWPAEDVTPLPLPRLTRTQMEEMIAAGGAP